MDKRNEVLKELGEIAKLLNIDIDYVIDKDHNREYLKCNNVKICTSGTSISGIREEWRNRSISPFENQTRNHIKQYWFDDNFNQHKVK